MSLLYQIFQRSMQVMDIHVDRHCHSHSDNLGIGIDSLTVKNDRISLDRVSTISEESTNRESGDVCHGIETTLGKPEQRQLYENSWGVDNAIKLVLYQVVNMYNNINAGLHTSETIEAGTSTEDEVVLSGGFQQYLIRNRDKLRVETEQPRKGNGSSCTTFHDLPDSLQLHIFSFIDAAVLCRISSVCRHWLMLSADDLLWKRLLQNDVNSWHVIGHSSNPMVYEECQSEWCYKDIYLRCSPEVNRIVRQQNINFHQLSSILRSLWPKKTPRFAMFGPGLESETSGLTRKIIETKTGVFDVTGMFPGKFGGVGSGFTIKMVSSGVSFNLMTLYMSTAHERENVPQAQRLRINRLLVARPVDEEVIEGVEPHYELQESVRNLCRTLDGLVFVVDASQSEETIALSRPELMAMVSELWSSPDVPVVVLSCVKEYTVTRLPCITIVETLQLGKLNRPWQVHDCVVQSLAGVQQAMQWLVEQAHRR